jgi:prophage regulatory protein
MSSSGFTEMKFFKDLKMTQPSPVIATLQRRPLVETRTGLSRSLIYKLMAIGDFPMPVKLTGKAVAWPSTAIDRWIEARIAQSNQQGGQ